MSQFCGSFCALTSRSRLTVIVYCPTSVTAVTAATEMPPITAAPNLRALPRAWMHAHLLGMMWMAAILSPGRRMKAWGYGNRNRYGLVERSRMRNSLLSSNKFMPTCMIVAATDRYQIQRSSNPGIREQGG